jgi:hypothetical protein
MTYLIFPLKGREEFDGTLVDVIVFGEVDCLDIATDIRACESPIDINNNNLIIDIPEEKKTLCSGAIDFALKMKIILPREKAELFEERGGGGQSPLTILFNKFNKRSIWIENS